MELANALPRLALKELELEAQGYDERHVRAAARMAWRQAEGEALRAPAPLREEVFLARLDSALEAAGRWIDGNLRAARDGDMAHGVDLAVAEGRPERGYRRMGVEGSVAAVAWERASPESKERYRAFWEEESHGHP